MKKFFLIAFLALLVGVLVLGSTPRPAHWKHLLYSIYRLGYGNPDSLSATEEAARKLARLDKDNTFTTNNTFSDTLTASGEFYADSTAFFADSVQFSEVISLADSAAFWEDFKVPLNQGKLGVGTPPNFTTFRDGLLQYSFAVGEQIYLDAEMPRGWDQDSIEIYIHWTPNTAGSGGGAENVQWSVEYSFQKPNAVFPASDTLTAEFDIQNEAQYEHLVSQIGTVPPPSGTELTSSIIICRLARIAATSNEYPDEVFGLEVDFHYRSNSLGSKRAKE